MSAVLRWLRAGALLGLLTVVGLAQAHKASDSYLQLDAATGALTVRWDIALRDLDVALDLDSDQDGRLTWGEVKAGWPRIQEYALAHLTIDGCRLRLTGQALERRNDGAYAVLFGAADCTLAQTPAIAYTLFRDVDPTHRGIAKIQRSGQPPALRMLDPNEPASIGREPSNDAGASSKTTQSDAIAPSGVGGFLREGVRHILTGYDHVLFLLCLLLPSVIRRTPQGWRPVERLSQAVWPVVGIVSAFTVAHSITLGLAALKLVSLSPAFIEPAIAVTIILAALDNVWPLVPVPRVVVTFFFGLIHGFGFAGVLAELNLPTAEFAWALLEFNLGLELGQLLIVGGAVGLMFLLRESPRYRLLVVRGGSMAAIAIATLWLIERTVNVSILPI